MTRFPARSESTRTHPQLERSLRLLLGAGLALVLLLPAARGFSEWLGWWPMWLVGMPAVALWALHRFRLPARVTVARKGVQAAPRRRRSGAQARRRVSPYLKRGLQAA
jgi:predicted MFS family arabinose efflux permease